MQNAFISRFSILSKYLFNAFIGGKAHTSSDVRLHHVPLQERRGSPPSPSDKVPHPREAPLRRRRSGGARQRQQPVGEGGRAAHHEVEAGPPARRVVVLCFLKENI